MLREIQMTDHEQQLDAELVKAWQEKRCEKSLNTLVESYYQNIFRRMKGKTNNLEDAEEVTQDTFVKLINSLDNYSDTGKFANYLSTIATSVLIDFYRKNGTSFDSDSLEYEMRLDNDSNRKDEETYFAEQKIEYLTTHCIPNLPTKERLVFLLLHESELWDFDTPLEWSHIAALNGIDTKTAWERFETARESLMKGASAKNLDMEDLLIFLLWTQAKRPFKAGHTLKYFAELIGEAEQNLRNWSHRAKKSLDTHLSQYVEALES